MKKRVIHYAVPDRNNQLVPWCETGYAAWERGSMVVMNTIEREVDCEHCKKHLAAKGRGPITRETLKNIKVLFRTPDSLALYGIPYNMREDCGQQPGDLWRAYRDYEPPPPGHYGSKQIDISDWVWLGTPGWFGHMTTEEIEVVKEFLAEHKDDVPGNPYEWSRIEP